MKYFSLLNGEKLQKASGKKVIPAAEFSQLLEGRDLIEKAQADVERYRSEVAHECEKLKETAEQRGFEEGQSRWNEQIALLEKEIERVHTELKKALVPVALQAAKKIVGREIEQNTDTVADIVLNNLKSVSSHKRITIYCNRQDLETLEKNKQRLKDLFEKLETLSIQERDDVAQGGCIIETEAGIINAQWNTQWQALESALRNVLKRE